MKTVTITGLIIYGAVVGLIAVWFSQCTDTVFLLNIPGTLLSFAVYDLSIRFFGEPHSSQAHYTIPWLLRIPQVYVPTSMLFWGILGTLFAMFLKPRGIALTMGAYLIVFGIVYLLAWIGA